MSRCGQLASFVFHHDGADIGTRGHVREQAMDGRFRFAGRIAAWAFETKERQV